MMVQVPVATNVTVLPETVQVAVLCELKITGRPEEALADIVNGGVPNVLFGSAPNVMVCASFVTVKICVTAGAGAYVALPACVARM